MKTRTKTVSIPYDRRRIACSENIAKHMGSILYIVLYDKFDFGFKKLENMTKQVLQLKEAYRDKDNDDVNVNALINYCDKKKINVFTWTRKVPMSQKFFLADMTKRIPLGAELDVDYGLAVSLLLSTAVLKEGYRFSNAKMEEFFRWIVYYIDSYAKKYVNDDDIRQVFIDECGFDIREGVKVS